MIEMITGTLAPPDQIDRVNLQAQQDNAPYPDCVISGPGRTGVTPVIWFCETCGVGWNSDRHPYVERQSSEAKEADLPIDLTGS